jgi:hypothetical protein
MADALRPRLEQGAAHMLKDLNDASSWPVLVEEVRACERMCGACSGDRQCSWCAGGRPLQKGVKVVYQAGSPDRFLASATIDASRTSACRVRPHAVACACVAAERGSGSRLRAPMLARIGNWACSERLPHVSLSVRASVCLSSPLSSLSLSTSHCVCAWDAVATILEAVYNFDNRLKWDTSTCPALRACLANDS